MGTQFNAINEKSPVRIVAKNLNIAESYAYELGLQPKEWLYAPSYVNLQGLKSGTKVYVVGDWRSIENIDQIYTRCHAWRHTLLFINDRPQ
jgi:hypothetical protein